MNNRIRRGLAKIEFIARINKINDLLAKGYNYKLIYEELVANTDMKMNYKTFMKYTKNSSLLNIQMLHVQTQINDSHKDKQVNIEQQVQPQKKEVREVTKKADTATTQVPKVSNNGVHTFGREEKEIVVPDFKDLIGGK